jgi:beta-lactamase class A
MLARVTTGPHRLKYRLPADTVVAHKTGTTAVVINDVGLITLPGDAGHLALAVFVMNGRGAATMQKVIADVAAVTYESFTGQVLQPPARPVKRATQQAGKPPAQLP